MFLGYQLQHQLLVGGGATRKHWLSFVAYIGDYILEVTRACNPL
jgi:hypothetical protein